MQAKTSNLDGSDSSIVNMPDRASNQEYVNDALGRSAGKIVICGDNLDQPTGMVIQIVAVNENLRACSLSLNGLDKAAGKSSAAKA